MATVSSTSLLSRTRSGRLPSGRTGEVTVGAATTSSTSSTPTSNPPPSLFLPSSYIAVFLTNLCLLDLDLRPDWPDISSRTFAASSKDVGQKRRIQSVEWALFQLFCLWDPDEARVKMQPYFPAADQVQSVNLRAAFLRALETAKKNGALGRDAILRKTMLDECRGERFEEILAVFSSAVLKKVVSESGDSDSSLALALSLEARNYASDRTQLHALILAHKASLARTLRHKEAARARYRDFSELLSLKERSIVRRREAAHALASEDASREQLSDDVVLRLQRLVRNNWSGSEQWMNALVYGDERTRKDGLLSTPPDRVWRRVQAGRLGELESKTDTGLLEQLDRRVGAQKERLHRWHEYGRHVLGKHQGATRTARQTPEKTQATKTGIDFGFDAHNDLHPTLNPKSRRHSTRTPSNDDYADLLRNFEADLASVNKPQGTTPLAAFLSSKAAKPGHARKESRAVDDDEVESEISDIDEHPIVQQQEQQLEQLQQQHLSAPPSEDAESPTRRRVLLTKKSMTFSVKSYHSDDEPSPPREFLPPAVKRAATMPNKSDNEKDRPLSPVLPPAVRKLSGQFRDLRDSSQNLPIRRRNQSPPIRAPPTPVIPRTPTPDRSPPPPSPPSDEDAPYELVSTPQHSIILQPPQSTDGDGSLPASQVASPTQDLADQILASMNNASPSPVKRPRHTLSLAERTRMSMARASRVDDSEDVNDENEESLAIRRGKTASGSLAVRTDTNTETNPDDDLIARTRKSMVGFEAARQKAQLDRRRSMRKSRQSSLGVGSGATSTATSRREAASNRAFAALDEDYEEEDTTMLAEELMSGGQDDAEAIFRSRPKIKMSPIPSPTRELEDDE